MTFSPQSNTTNHIYFSCKHTHYTSTHPRKLYRYTVLMSLLEIWGNFCQSYLYSPFHLIQKDTPPLNICNYLSSKASLSDLNDFLTMWQKLCTCRKVCDLLSGSPGCLYLFIFQPVVLLDKSLSLVCHYVHRAQPCTDLLWYSAPLSLWIVNFPFLVSAGFTTSCQRWLRRKRKRKKGLYHKATDCELRCSKRWCWCEFVGGKKLVQNWLVHVEMIKFEFNKFTGTRQEKCNHYKAMLFSSQCNFI